MKTQHNQNPWDGGHIAEVDNAGQLRARRSSLMISDDIDRNLENSRNEMARRGIVPGSVVLWSGNNPSVYTVRDVTVDRDFAEIDRGTFTDAGMLVPIDWAIAAPDLLAALEEIERALLYSCAPSMMKGARWQFCMNTARAAIAKARGLE